MAQEYQGAGTNRFLVPQYIDTEPKILGPITVRQFVLMLVSAMIGFLIWKIFETGNQILGIVFILLQFGVFFVFAFAVINGQKFHFFFLNLLTTAKRAKLRVYKRELIASTAIEEVIAEQKVKIIKKLPPKSKLSDISLLVDTGGAYNMEELGNKEITPVQDMNI